VAWSTAVLGKITIKGFKSKSQITAEKNDLNQNPKSLNAK